MKKSLNIRDKRIVSRGNNPGSHTQNRKPAQVPGFAQLLPGATAPRRGNDLPVNYRTQANLMEGILLVL